MKLTFLGATDTVTGSKYLVEYNGRKILIDCGLFQGFKELRLRNWGKFPVNPEDIFAVILTHAHIDHSGYIPLLVRNGFKGRIYCTPATYDLCTILLPDSGYLQEEDARRANKYGYSKHKPALPLYTRQEAIESLKSFRTVNFDKMHRLFDDLNFVHYHAGHIIGASSILVKTSKISILFSGDIGRLNDPVMNPPEDIKAADYIIVESTYGNKLHEKISPQKQLSDVINETASRGGSIIIPSFAVGRAQSILYYINELKGSRKIPDLPVYLDSPMAIDANEILCKYHQEHKLSKRKCGDICNIAEYIRTPEESKNLDKQGVPSIIISASGMATGGRVLHHLKYFITDSRNTILFAGFQAGGTRGRRLLDGEESIKMHGEYFPVRASIKCLDNISAHADYEEILTWLGKAKESPKCIFITHGESKAAESLRLKIEEKLKWRVSIPYYLQVVNCE